MADEDQGAVLRPWLRALLWLGGAVALTLAYLFLNVR